MVHYHFAGWPSLAELLVFYVLRWKNLLAPWPFCEEGQVAEQAVEHAAGLDAVFCLFFEVTNVLDMLRIDA